MKFSSSSSCPILLFYLHVLILLIIIISTSEAVVKLPENISIPAIIAFGDSIVDQGNNNNLKTLIKCDFPPYGKDFKGGMPTGRFCNGKTPADIIAEELGIKEIVPAYLDPNLQAKDLPTGVSFASGASGYDPQTPKLVSVLSFPDQVKMFKDYAGKLKGLVGEEETNNILTNSLFLVVAGTDDLANTYFTIGIRKLEYDVDSYTSFLVHLATNFVKELYELGARRIAVFGSPPIGCLPAQRTLAGGVERMCSEKYNQAAKLYNTKLSNALDSLKSSLNDTKAGVFYVDIYNPLLHLIQNGEKYGFAVVDKGCCGTGAVEVAVLCNKFSKTCADDSAYLFWDSYHPTEQGYRALINMILQKYINKIK